jgi:hypothetical protein
VLQKAGLSDEADPENNLGGSSETMYFIGLDVHKKTISFCVKDAAGCVHGEGKIGSTRRELDAWVRTLPQPRMIAMEATIFTGWIYDYLLPHAEKVKVAHPSMRVDERGGAGSGEVSRVQEEYWEVFAPTDRTTSPRRSMSDIAWFQQLVP